MDPARRISNSTAPVSAPARSPAHFIVMGYFVVRWSGPEREVRSGGNGRWRRLGAIQLQPAAALPFAESAKP